MSRRQTGFALAVAIAAFGVAVGAGAQTAGAPSHVVKGLSMTARAIARAKIVSLRDCPPGENTQRGVIRPAEDSEFVTITVDIKVPPGYRPVPIGRPVLQDAAGNTYGTGQSFVNVAAAPASTCDFSFRVPAGTAAARLVIDGVSLDLTRIGK